MQGHPEDTASFVGRRSELAALHAALAAGRLVTLTGPGGVGKSRLARQALATPPAAFPDGIHWADLSPLPDAQLLVATVSDALDLADHTVRSLADAVRDWLVDRRLLLVLDCCEHLIAEVRDLVADLLDAAPGLSVLLTSRQPLDSPLEYVVDVGPLPQEETRPEALTLFADHVARVSPSQARPWGRRQEDAARLVCARLEGVPLALELAAAQLSELTLEQLAARLAGEIGPLAADRPVGPHHPARHRALRTAIGWSHEWCTPRERLLWLRLSVFGGPFDLAAARAICSAAPLNPLEVAGLLDSLVAKSVVRRTGAAESDGGTHRMLDTIREYGAMWLGELGEGPHLRARHAAYFYGMVRAADREWLGPAQRTAYRRIAGAHGDVCAALDFYLESEPVRAVELAGRVGFFWACSGHLHAARAYLERALDLAPDDEPAGEGRLRALWALGVTLLLQGEQELAHEVALGCEALALRDDFGLDRAPVLDTAYLLGLSHLLAGRPLAARIVADNALEAAPGHFFDSGARVRCHLVRVFALTGMGLLPEARREATALREGCVARDEHWTRAYADYQLALISLFEDLPEEAAGHARSMLDSKRELGDSFGTALGLDLLAAARAAAGDGEGGARAYGAGHAYWQAVGHPQRGTPELKGVRDRFEETARGALGDEAYEAAFQEGVRHGRALRLGAGIAGGG
ncbi:ATP-binding protein [Streptomyces sp. BI20]|uniref:ATP-binding protein n=1 Tax=Streptomyces sp. BI20 TaxID=3403460 RepID=UPI003C768C35